MGLTARLKRDYKFLQGLFRTLGRVRSIAPDSPHLICDDLEAAVDSWRDSRAISFEGRTISYGELDAMANRYAHWAQDHRVHKGDVVALYAPNRLDYLAIWYGLSKVGVATALINNNLAGAQLSHCLNISNATHAIVDDETAAALEATRGQLKRGVAVWTLGRAQAGQHDLAKALTGCSSLRPDRSTRADLTARATALYIFTSGTTGLPKAARITHMRAQLYMRGFAGATGAKADDRVYVVLPLYHATGGLCAMGAALLNGGSVALRAKFSASHFWSDVRDEGCTMAVYIGELCRYLLNQPEAPDQTGHRLRQMFGNGLRPEVWEPFQQRFRVPDILEFYGSTEGNVSLFNFDGKPGAIGRIPVYMQSRFNIRLVRFDVETQAPVRGADGQCQATSVGEVGECIGKINAGDARAEYSGYADKAASEKKVLRDVFAAGDAWFATGDLMRQDEEGYFYFVDRVGDTFRWKGENVSTSEVAEQLAVLPGVKEAIVYGVRVGDLDGRAGMVSLVVDEGFDIGAFAAQVDASMPAYQRPLFVRLQPEVEITGTFKYRKMDLVEEGFDPAKVRQPLFFKDVELGYTPMTKPLFEAIMTGTARV
jgi:fatty-acyl-CoA synthase